MKNDPLATMLPLAGRYTGTLLFVWFNAVLLVMLFNRLDMGWYAAQTLKLAPVAPLFFGWVLAPRFVKLYGRKLSLAEIAVNFILCILATMVLGFLYETVIVYMYLYKGDPDLDFFAMLTDPFGARYKITNTLNLSLLHTALLAAAVMLLFLFPLRVATGVLRTRGRGGPD